MLPTTIVRHRTTRGLYAVIGTGYGLASTAIIFPTEQREERAVVIVTDRHGTLGKFPMDELEVVQVCGVTPAEAIADALARFADAPAPPGA